MSDATLLALAVLALAGAARAQLPPADAPPAPPHNDTRCGSECVRCAADGCVKCARLLVLPAATCSHACPPGTRESWAHDDHVMGRVCYPARSYREIIVGGACGAVLCVVLVGVVAAYARCRRKSRTQSQPLPQRPRHDDDASLREFQKQLDCLRPHAYTLLAILNHTRHQVRELYQLGNNEAAMAYSCVLSDLAKLLILLNKQQVPIVPDEWPRLSSWAERVLKRYSRLSQPQEEGQLVNFLPCPPSHQGSDSDSTQQSFTTFKPPSYSPNSCDSNMLNKDQDSSSEWNNVGGPPSYTQIEKDNDRRTMVMTNQWTRRPLVRRESVWLEDELFEMTRRPQDELTTEL